MRVADCISEDFLGCSRVHQGSAVISITFIVVMEDPKQGTNLWELLNLDLM